MITCCDIKTCIHSIGWIRVISLYHNNLWFLPRSSDPQSFYFKWGFEIRIIDNLLWYKDKHLICRPDVGTSLYTKAIFHFHLNYLIQNLDFEVRLATWRSCYITHFVANLQQSHPVAPLSNPCPIQSEIDQVFCSKMIVIFKLQFIRIAVYIVFYYELTLCWELATLLSWNEIYIQAYLLLLTYFTEIPK